MINALKQIMSEHEKKIMEEKIKKLEEEWLHNVHLSFENTFIKEVIGFNFV